MLGRLESGKQRSPSGYLSMGRAGGTSGQGERSGQAKLEKVKDLESQNKEFSPRFSKSRNT